LREYEKQIMDELERLKVVPKATDCRVWSNVFGGCVMFIGTDNNDNLDEPLNEEAIKEVKHIHVIDKRYLTPNTWYESIEDEKYGEPETYRLTPEVASRGGNSEQLGEATIHESRLIRFNGERTAVDVKQQQNGWDDSLLKRINKVIRDVGVGWDTLNHLLSSANQPVFKMAGLIDAIAADEPQLISGRMTLLDQKRSAVRALVLDADGEEFEHKNTTWTGVSEPYELLMYRLSLALGYPATVLMGRSPAGENATGESDATIFDSVTEAEQTFKIKPQMRKLVELLLNSNLSNINIEGLDWDIEFPPLRSLTEEQEAGIRSTMAEADAKNIVSGVYTPEEAAMSRFGPDGFSVETDIDIATRLDPDEPEQPMIGEQNGEKEVETVPTQEANEEPTPENG